MPSASEQRTAEAFKVAGLVINKAQAQALADLMWEGKHVGTTLRDADPPTSLALVGVGPREGMGQALALNRDGDYRLENGHSVWEPDPDAHTLAVVAEDGRMWQIVRAGITWPVSDA